jgi:hypothetical protein
MNTFYRFKEWMGRRSLLREKLPERRPIPRNLVQASKVGIVYVADDEKAFHSVRNYVKRLKEEYGISRVLALGYVHGKHLPAHLSTRLNFDQFTSADCNWFGIPGGNTVRNFVVEEYEVLMDFTLEDRLPVQSVVARSRARFKVGRYSESNERFLDMMIDMAGSNSLGQLIAQVDNYMAMVNSSAKAEPALH